MVTDLKIEICLIDEDEGYLHDRVRRGDGVVDDDHGGGDEDEEDEERGHVVLVHAQKVSLVQHFNVNILQHSVHQIALINFFFRAQTK